jgi:hypothetical protein
MTSAAFNNRVNDCAAVARIGITEKPGSVDGNVELESHPLVGLRAPKFFILMFTSGHDNPTLRAEKRWQRN